MVKGVARHAVIVRPPDQKQFEQAIFIVAGDGPEPQIKSPGEMLALACDLASKHQVSAGPGRARQKGRFFGYLLSFLAGCVVTAAAWWAVYSVLFI